MSKLTKMNNLEKWVRGRIFLVLETIRPDKGKHGFSNTQFILDEINKTVAESNRLQKPKSAEQQAWESLPDWYETYTLLEGVLRKLVSQRQIKSRIRKNDFEYQLYTQAEKKRHVDSQINNLKKINRRIQKKVISNGTAVA